MSHICKLYLNQIQNISVHHITENNFNNLPSTLIAKRDTFAYTKLLRRKKYTKVVFAKHLFLNVFFPTMAHMLLFFHLNTKK
jgi:hypothetical protein